MAEYKFDDEIVEVDRDLERAIIRRFLEKRYITLSALLCFIICFLLGVIAS